MGDHHRIDFKDVQRQGAIRMKTVRRDKLALDQKNFAVKVGLSEKGIWSLENSKVDPKLSTLVKLFNALGENPFSLNERQATSSTDAQRGSLSALTNENSETVDEPEINGHSEGLSFGKSRPQNRILRSANLRQTQNEAPSSSLPRHLRDAGAQLVVMIGTGYYLFQGFGSGTEYFGVPMQDHGDLIKQDLFALVGLLIAFLVFGMSYRSIIGKAPRSVAR